MNGKPGMLYYFTLVMTGVYFIIGLFLIFAPSAAEALPGWRHTALGIFLFLYGVYRIFRLRKIRQNPDL